ncbi:hypothetical protein LCGC14_3016020 [marine sediment metagenome]|uniref:Uncharacterized protein n=1 Tax=marine sediment metagenome TaxID=412755 RepID=A0A0F8WWL5_9ZZZZ
MRTIKVNFSKCNDDLSVLGNVLKKYIDMNGCLPTIPTDHKITKMSYHPVKGENGKKFIKLEMEIARF